MAGPEASRSEIGHCRAGACRVAGSDEDEDAGLGELAGDLQSDPLVGTSDQGDTRVSFAVHP